MGWHRVEDVLRGRKRVSIEDLFRLVHRVNPTPRKLDATEIERRYGQKAALQSLLIREHSEALEVRPAEDPDIVSIGHRFDDRDACHARISALDDDARSWVRMQLDAWDDAAPARAVVAGAAREVDLVSQGRRALDAYDFPAAEACFREVLSDAPGPEAALALLELLVDHLARDADALELRLHPTLKSDLRVRAYLARAAIRTADPDRALAFARGVPDADLHCELGQALLELERLEDARRSLHTARELEPASGRVARLLDDLAARVGQLKAERRRPEEEALEELARSRDWHALVRRAAEVLGRFPRSRRARELKAEAEQALQDEAAADRARRAEALRVSRARARLERESAEDARLEGALQRGVDAALVEWLQLEDLDRHRELLAGEPLSELESLRGRAPAARVVAAVRALERAESGGPESLAHLRPHLPLLRSLERARSVEARLKAEAQARKDEADRRRAEEAREARRRRRERQFEAAWTEAALAEDWLVARRIARGAGRNDRAEEAERRLRASWGWSEIEGGPYPDRRIVGFSFLSGGVIPWLLGDDEFVWISGLPGRWLHLSRDGVDGAVRSSLQLRLPVAIDEHFAHQVCGRRVFVGAGEWVLVLGVDPWALLDLLNLRELVGDVGSIHSAVAADEGRVLWVRTEDGGDAQSWVVDVDRRAVVARARGGLRDLPLHGGRVARLFQDAFEVVHARNATGGRRVKATNPRCVSRCGRELVAFVDEVDAYGVVEQTLAFLQKDRRLLLTLKGSCPSDRAQLAVSDDGLVWAISERRGGGSGFFCARRQGSTAEPKYEAVLPSDRCILVRDSGGRRGALALFHLGGLELVELGPDPPDIPEVSIHTGMVAIDAPYSGFLGQHYFAELRKGEPEPGSLGELASRLGALEAGELLGPIDAALAEDPGNGVLLAMRLWALGENRRWAECLDVPVVRDLLPRALRMHVDFIQGCARARLGDLEAAASLISEELAFEYRNQAIFEAARLLQHVLGRPGAEDRLLQDPCAYGNVDRIRQADQCLGEGDHAKAVQALDVPMTWRLLEAQSLARLARSLEAIGDDVAGKMRARACGSFLALALESHGVGVPLGDEELSLEEMTRIRDRVLA